MPRLSVVIPIKDEADNLPQLWQRLRLALDPLPGGYEVVFVDDGSTDDSYALLERLAGDDDRFKAVRLRRNFGQSAALRAGIDHARGDVIATMDGDLQNDPADIPVLLTRLDEGYDAVLGLRANRQDGLWLRKLPSWVANWLIRSLTGVSFRDFGCTLRVMTRDLACSLPLYGEMHRFISVLAVQCGARMTQVPVRHHPRLAGRSKYGLGRMTRVILDLITVQFLHRYLTRPMHALGTWGLSVIALGLGILLATVLMKLVSGIDMTGNPLLLLSVFLAVVGVQFISLGLLGEVLTRVYFESQDKPSYTVRSRLHLGDIRRITGRREAS